MKETASELFGDVTLLDGAPAGYTEFITDVVNNAAALAGAQTIGAVSVIRVL